MPGFPNTHEVLPLPPHPQIEQYKKLAKDLARAHHASPNQSSEASIEAWARRWLTNLASLLPEPQSVLDSIGRVAAFAQRTLAPRTLQSETKGALSSAQFVIARCHGFASWPTMIVSLDRLAHANSAEAAFESAIDAVVTGQEFVLRGLLQAQPDLVKARSARQHHATLLHYTAANGVENYRQRTPHNIVAIAELLLQSGSDVNAAADIYGGGATTLGLAATSGWPRQAGVQIALLEVLLQHGAVIEDNQAGAGRPLIHACLGNGHPAAAEFLANRGAQLDLASMLGLGWLEIAQKQIHAGYPGAAAHREEALRQLNQGFLWAASFGHQDVVKYLLEFGVNIAVQDKFGQTALHRAAMQANASMTKLLFQKKAPLEVENIHRGTPLGQALWSAANSSDPDRFAEVIASLLTAGAKPVFEPGPISPAIDQLLRGLPNK